MDEKPGDKADDTKKVRGGDKPASRKRKAKEIDSGEGVPEESARPRRKSDQGTFAGRYRPTDETKLASFTAIQSAFMAKVAPLIRRQSSFQD